VGLRSSQARLYRQGTALAVVGAPLLFLVANILHPEEFERDHEREQLAEIAANYTTWQLAHFLTFASVVVFAAAVLGLAYLVRRRRPAAGLVFGGLALAGLFGIAFIDALDGYTWAILGEVSTRPEADQATLELALNDVQQSSWSIPYYLTPLLFIVGLVALAIHAARQGAIPLGAALLLALGAVLLGGEAAIQDNTYFIVAATVLFLGGAAVATALSRMSDDEYETGAVS
jgi:FtsH-binding integral membrane protein